MEGECLLAWNGEEGLPAIRGVALGRVCRGLVVSEYAQRSELRIDDCPMPAES